MSTFSCAYWPFVYVLWKNVYSGTLPILNWVIFVIFLLLSFMSFFFYILDIACLVTQLCPTLCDAMDYSPPGSSFHGSCQARILERVAISFSRGSSLPRGRTRVSCVSCIGRQILYQCATWGPPFWTLTPIRCVVCKYFLLL